jgi:peptidoglycan hydrolase FlgJ
MTMSINQQPLDALRDPSGAALKARAASDPKATIKAAAKQFEALFMQQLMKSMRDATLSSGMLENAGTQMGTEMLDTQFANQMTGLPGGLSEVIVRQLERQMNLGPAAPAATHATPRAALAPAAAAGAPARTEAAASLNPTQSQFVRLHESAARAAEADTGIPATFMVAQAAHESGWGQREIRRADGSSAFNVFGIKAGPGWRGATTSITTTEFEAGQPRKVVAQFRAYASYEESFKDYARLMKNNPRYSEVLAAGHNASSFAHGLQRAGYATDPAYAEKLTRVINTTLRLQRAST